MRTIINDLPTLLDPAAADAVAADLNADPEDECTYRAVHDPKGTGRSFVEILDDSGLVLGRL